MNSIMQQFYNTPTVRQGVLTLASPNGADGNMLDDRQLLAVELQRMFGELALSDMQDCSALGLVSELGLASPLMHRHSNHYHQHNTRNRFLTFHFTHTNESNRFLFILSLLTYLPSHRYRRSAKI